MARPVLLDFEIVAHDPPVSGEGADERLLPFILGQVDEFLRLPGAYQGTVGENLVGHAPVPQGDVGILLRVETGGSQVGEITNGLRVLLVNDQGVLLHSVGGGDAGEAEDDAVALLDLVQLPLVGFVEDKLEGVVHVGLDHGGVGADFGGDVLVLEPASVAKK